MSFILDALRKSELERQRQHGPSIAEIASARTDHRPPWALAVIGGLLALNVGVILFFLFRDSKEDAPQAPAATTTAAAATPQAAAPAPAASAPAATTAPQATAPMTATYPANEPQDLAAALPSPNAAASSFPPAGSDPTLVPAPSATPPSVQYDSAAPSSDALTAQAAEGMPELSMDLHIFSADPAKRAVFINGRRYTEGATIAEGAIVREITKEGAVLEYRGRRFLLPRL